MVIDATRPDLGSRGRRVTMRTLPFEIVNAQRGSFLAVTMALIAVLPGLHAAAAAPDLFDEIYARGQKQNTGLKTMTATFIESSTSALLATPLVERGLVFVERPTRIALRYTDPATRVVLMDGDRMTVSWPSAGIHTVTDISAAQRRVQKYFVDSSAKELRGHFDITAREAQDRLGTYLVTLVPKRKQIQEGVTRIELWLDRSTLLLAAMRMTFPSGDTKLMTFTDVALNTPIDPAMFKVRSLKP
jgi:outer membrane lipoprotein-sorting protein